MTGLHHSRPTAHHPRHRPSGVDQTTISQHQPSCASCTRATQQFSLPRDRYTPNGYNKENYLTMPTRAISTGDDYRIEHDAVPLRRGASYHHLQRKATNNTYLQFKVIQAYTNSINIACQL